MKSIEVENARRKKLLDEVIPGPETLRTVLHGEYRPRWQCARRSRRCGNRLRFRSALPARRWDWHTHEPKADPGDSALEQRPAELDHRRFIMRCGDLTESADLYTGFPHSPLGTAARVNPSRYKTLANGCLFRYKPCLM